MLLQQVLVLMQAPDATQGTELLLKKHCVRAGHVVDLLLDILNYYCQLISKYLQDEKGSFLIKSVQLNKHLLV